MQVLRYFNITKNIAQRLNYWKNGQIMIKRKITNKLQESGFTWTMNLCTSRFIS